ncbi:unnamed protein product, partial [Prorocentrum cordatum]
TTLDTLTSWKTFKLTTEKPAGQYDQAAAHAALCALVASGAKVPDATCFSTWRRGAGLAADQADWATFAGYMTFQAAQWHATLHRPPITAGEGEPSVSRVIMETLVVIFRQPANVGVGALTGMLQSIGGSATGPPPLLTAAGCEAFATEVERLCRLVFIAAVPDAEVDKVVGDKEAMLDVHGEHPSPFLKALMFLPTGIAVLHAVSTEGARIKSKEVLAGQLNDICDIIASMQSPLQLENEGGAAGVGSVALPKETAVAVETAMGKYDQLMSTMTDRFKEQRKHDLDQVSAKLDAIGADFETATKERNVALLNRALVDVSSVASRAELDRPLQLLRAVAEAEGPRCNHLAPDRASRVSSAHSRTAEAAHAWAPGLAMLMSDNHDNLKSSELQQFYDQVVMSNENCRVPLETALGGNIANWPPAVLKARLLLQCACSAALTTSPFGVLAAASRMEAGTGDLAKECEAAATNLSDDEEWSPRVLAPLDALSCIASTICRFRPAFSPGWKPSTQDPANPAAFQKHSGDHVLLAIKMCWFCKERRAAQSLVDATALNEDGEPGSALYPAFWQHVDGDEGGARARQ